MYEKLEDSPLGKLLDENEWGEYQNIIDDLKSWTYYGMFADTLIGLKREALYKSPVHGSGHIERTLLFGALLAHGEELVEDDCRMLLGMCAYHDTGRVSDWLDEYHGLRSCAKLKELTGMSGEKLKMMMAGVEAHSRRDSEMDDVLKKYEPEDFEHCRRIAFLLKDADGLDRVRIGDLDPVYMRTKTAKSLTRFSGYLFERYSKEQVKLGQEPVRLTEVSKVILEQMREHVRDCYEKHDYNCAVTTLTALGTLFDTKIEEQTIMAAAAMHGAGRFGAQCGLVEGALMFFGIYYGARGLDKYAIAEKARRYAADFTERFGSLECRELRPGGFNDDDPPHLCASLTLETILFARQFILKA